MPNPLTDALVPRRGEISAEVHRRLHDSTAVHYRQIDPDLLQDRADRLVDRFLDSLPDRPAVFIDYIKSLADARIGEGFFLGEIQLALCILEERAWALTVESVPAGEQVRSLAVISGIIGAAKDQLAQVYLEKLQAARSLVIDLERRCEILAAGTDSGPVAPTA